MRRLETPPYQFALRDEARLRELFERALREPRSGPRDALAALRDGVGDFVRRSRADGRQIETIIVALKDIFGVPDRPLKTFRDEADTPSAVLLMRRVVRWCIEEYYGGE